MATKRGGTSSARLIDALGRAGVTPVPGDWLLAAIALGTGAALAVAVLTTISLPVGVAMSLLFSVGAILYAQRRLPVERRQILAARVRAGFIAGVVATLAYDGMRLAVLLVAPHVVWPFDVFGLFGQLLLPGAPSIAQSAVGVVFHAANGIGFAVAFTLIFVRPSPWTGLAWGFGLELLTVSLYPGWLGLRALDEFVTMSVAGHATYGLVLGGMSRAILDRRPGMTDGSADA